MSYGDRRPLFQLCWNFSGDAGRILSGAIPDDNRVLGPYLAYLLGYDRFAAADGVASKMLDRVTADDAPILLSYCSRSLSVGRPGLSLNVWNVLAGKKLISYPALDPVNGPVLTNGDFRTDLSSEGFDWKASTSAGVTAHRELLDPPQYKIQLDGKQPEVCELLAQYLPLAPGRHYEFRFEYQTEGIGPDNGLSWRISLPDGSAMALRSPQLSSAAWKAERAGFTASGNGMARLVLLYQRKPGTTRIEGTIALRGIRVDP